MKRFAVWLWLLVLALGLLACRQGQPGTDPKTPPNSPIPKIEKPDNDPGSTPTPTSIRDGG